jgi:RNA 2',3'-cyclic 3'-phosphodiesterase
MDQIRSFISIELPETVKLELAGVESKLKRACSFPVKWVSPDNIHLTLKFLGNIENSKINVIIEAVSDALYNERPFFLNLTGLDVFPNLKNIKVVWVGLGGEINTLKKVQNKIEMRLIPLGFLAEKRLFTAHLTLARINENVSYSDKQVLAEIISHTDIDCDFSFKVNSVNLMRSQLTRKGAIYSRLSLIEIKSSCQ